MQVQNVAAFDMDVDIGLFDHFTGCGEKWGRDSPLVSEKGVIQCPPRRWRVSDVWGCAWRSHPTGSTGGPDLAFPGL